MQGRETDRENAAETGRAAEGMVNFQAIRDTGIAAIVGTRTEVDVIMNDGRVAEILRAGLIEGMAVNGANLLLSPRRRVPVLPDPMRVPVQDCLRRPWIHWVNEYAITVRNLDTFPRSARNSKMWCATTVGRKDTNLPTVRRKNGTKSWLWV